MSTERIKNTENNDNKVTNRSVDGAGKLRPPKDKTTKDKKKSESTKSANG